MNISTPKTVGCVSYIFLDSSSPKTCIIKYDYHTSVPLKYVSYKTVRDVQFATACSCRVLRCGASTAVVPGGPSHAVARQPTGGPGIGAGGADGGRSPSCCTACVYAHHNKSILVASTCYNVHKAGPKIY
jgi:hypothetical protein